MNASAKDLIVTDYSVSSSWQNALHAQALRNTKEILVLIHEIKNNWNTTWTIFRGINIYESVGGWNY